MPTLQHLSQHIRRHGFSNKPLYTASVMIFFFAVFDGLLAFVAPLVITEMGVNETVMGIIIGTSSLAGIVFDVMLCRVLENSNYRRLFLLMFGTSAIYPL